MLHNQSLLPNSPELESKLYRSRANWQMLSAKKPENPFFSHLAELKYNTNGL